MRPAVRFGDAEFGKQEGGRLCPHWPAAVGMQGELAGWHVMLGDGVVKQSREQGSTFGIGDAPADNARGGLGRRTDSAGGKDRRLAMRFRLARDRPRAAQVAATAPLAGKQAASPSVRARCLARSAPAEFPADRQVFLDLDDRLGPLQAVPQLGDVAACSREFCVKQR